MKKLILSSSIIAITSGMAMSQDIYGNVGGSWQFNNVTNILGDPAVGDPGQEPATFGQFSLNGSVGVAFDNGFYGQVDLRYIDTDVLEAADDVLHNGSLVALRGGKNFDTFRAGGFVGYVDVTGDDSDGSNKMYRMVYGIDGEIDLSPKIAMFAELGGIGENMGTQGSDGDDGIHDAGYLIIGASYDLTNAISIDAQVGGAKGTHDEDPLDIFLVGAAVNYQTNIQGLSAFARVDYTEYFQHNEDEALGTTNFMLGLSYAFGAPTLGRQPRALAPYEDWLGYSGGHLE